MALWKARRVSEVLASMLCASFILSSGVVKSVGVWLIQTWHMDQFWMPAATGLLFMPMLLVSVWVLSLLPPPNARDEAERVRRLPMNGAERAEFLKAYAPGPDRHHIRLYSLDRLSRFSGQFRRRDMDRTGLWRRSGDILGQRTARGNHRTHRHGGRHRRFAIIGGR